MSTKITDTSIELSKAGAVGTVNINNGVIELYRYDSNSPYAGPYIDFKNSNSDDYDARIQCTADNTGRGLLEISVFPNIVAMKMDRSGAVRMPQRPAFDVASTAGGGGYVNMNVNYVNNGSHFNFSTDRFTAPVDGTYKFYLSAIKQTSSPGSVGRIYLYKNGVVQYDSRHLRLGESQDYGTSGCVVFTITMNAGDYAQYYSGGSIGAHASTNYTYFGGYLIS